MLQPFAFKVHKDNSVCKSHLAQDVSDSPARVDCGVQCGHQCMREWPAMETCVQARLLDVVETRDGWECLEPMMRMMIHSQPLQIYRHVNVIQ